MANTLTAEPESCPERSSGRYLQGLSHIQHDTKPCSGSFSAPLQSNILPHEQTHRQPSDLTLTLNLMSRDNTSESLWYRIGQRKLKLMLPLPKLIHRMRVDWWQCPW